MPNLIIFGLGYSGRAIARAAAGAGFAVTATTRSRHPPERGVTLIPFAEAASALAQATHLVTTAGPDEAGDPVLAHYAQDLAAARGLRWIGYLSTTGVYGNRDGGWVDEDTAPVPESTRGQRRMATEAAWAAAATGRALDIFRLAGIYGPGRSVLDDLRAGKARRVVKPGHLFGRIHRDDIAHGVLAAMRQSPATGRRIFNFVDDEPAASADVVAEGARLLGLEAPPPVPFEEAVKTMSPMAKSFWADSRRIANAKTKAALNLSWLYPTYREGLRAVIAEELAQGSL